MKIGIIGSGVVAQTLGAGFLKHGHSVTLGTRSPEKLADWKKANPAGNVASMREAARSGELVVLAVKGSAAADALEQAGGGGELDGKTVVDATNPIADAAPVNGVLAFTTDLRESQMEKLQRGFPGARFVKAFNSVGHANMVDPSFEGGKPTMFICGNDAQIGRASCRERG